MIDGKMLFDWPVKNDSRTFDNIWKIATGEGDNYKAGCLLGYFISVNILSYLQ